MPIISDNLHLNIDYIPLGKQSLFHLSGAKYRLYIGAWRAGKTYAGCQEAWKQSYLYPGNCGLIGRKDFTDLRDTTIKTLFEVIPEDFIKSYNKTEHHLVLKNNSEIYFRELKDGTGLGSLNLGWFYIDEAEEIEESIFERLKGRLSLKGTGCRGWLTSNPPNEDHWLFQQFEKSSDADFATFHASTYENRENLPDGYIDDLEKLPASWRKKYIEGEYGFTPDGTPYYEGYIENIHKRDIAYEAGLPLHCGWDFGYQRPAFVVTQIDKASRWKILWEILSREMTIDKFADTVVLPMLAQRFAGATFIHYGDPACLQTSDKSEQTTYSILLNKGILIHCKPSEYRLRKEIIDKKINTIIEGVPSLLVNTPCRIINDGFLGGYHYPIYNNDKQFVDKYERPFHDNFYSHLMNALEYIAVHVFSPIDHKPQPKRDIGPQSLSNI